MSKKFIFATLSYVVLTLAIAYPWHFVWFKDLLDQLGMYNRAEPIIALGILSMVIQGAVMAYLYPFYYKNGKPLVEGIKFGLIFGLFLFSVSTLANAAKMNVSSITTFVELQAAFHFIQFVITGGAIGLIYGKLGSRD